MKWLLLDAGNTALKWALVRAEQAQWSAGEFSTTDPSLARRGGTLPLEHPDFRAQFERDLAQALALDPGGTKATAQGLKVLGSAVVAPETIFLVEDAIAAAVATTSPAGVATAPRPAIQWLSAVKRFEHDGITLRNSYREPLLLGADRWHSMIGARALFPHVNLAVVNAGTATTVDGVDMSGNFLGGVIAPGLELMRSSLAQAAARLPLAQGEPVAHPDNTDDAIRTGITDALVGLIEQRLRRIRERAGSPVQIVLSGGNRHALQPLLQAQRGLGDVALDAELVLRGVWHRARALASAQITSAPA